jgi:DNA-directed RNA polymerase specialized sigma subunit
MNFMEQPKNDSLEPQYRDAFNAWKQKPSPGSTGFLVRTIEPEISKGINMHVGKPNPLIRSRARKLTIQALSSYDPSRGVKLGTHVINQLQGLKRINRQQTTILKTPERVGIEQNRVRLAEQELQDELGRDPSMVELADYTGLSTKRLKHLQRFHQGMSEGRFAQMGEDGEGFDPAVEEQGDDPWIELVYGDLDPVNQKIMEWTLGLNGQPVRPNQDIAMKLGITPGAVSQRKAKIQALLDEGQQRSPF